MLRRNGDPAVRVRVEMALRTGQACWCPLVQLELWNGAGGQQEQKALREFARVLPELRIDDEVWRIAHDLARRAIDRATSRYALQGQHFRIDERATANSSELKALLCLLRT